MTNQISFTEPALCHYNHDISKSWFIYFDITNVATGEKIRKQVRADINKSKDKKGRLAAANALISAWTNLINSGLFNPFEKDSESGGMDLPKNVLEAVDKIFDLKSASLKSESIRSYGDISKRFKAWCKTKHLHTIPLYAFNHTMAQGYCDYLLLERKYSGKTHNNHLNIMRGFFSLMKKRWPALVKENPFKEIEMLPTDIGGNLAYTAKEREVLINYFKEHKKRVYYAIQFMFHGFIRKTELTYLRVGDIDWENGTITINSKAAKNRNQDSITIPEGLFPILYEMGLDMAPKHFYIFGHLMETSEKKISSQNRISTAHMVGKKKAGLPENDGKSFYSWKHTGVVSYWSVIKDPYYMMRQLRHSDLKTTMIYMKSLGLMPNDAFKNARVIL